MKKTGSLRKFKSYFVKEQIEKGKSQKNPGLHVAFEKGILRLNSSTINYSEKGRHTVFEKAFKQANASEWKVKKVLVLGLGSGGILGEIKRWFGPDCGVTGVEHDEEVLRLGAKYFDLQSNELLKVVHGEAVKFVKQCSDQFDLIIVDAFQDKYVPIALQQTEFIDGLISLLSNEGSILFNYIRFDERTERGFDRLFKIFQKKEGALKKLDASLFGAGNWILYFKINS